MVVAATAMATAMSDDDDDDDDDDATTGNRDGGGCLRLFQSTPCVDRVVGDAGYDRRHRNRARG